MTSIFTVSFPEQEEAIKTLLKESRERNGFYLLLGIATFVVTLGLLINSLEAIIGGALVAPLLYPILSLALAVVTSSRLSLGRSLKLLGRASVFVVIISALSGFVFSAFTNPSAVILATAPSLPVFMIAFASGLAVAFAWVKRDFSAALPGVAMTVSILPPLAGVGIGLVFFSYQIISQSILLLIINWLGMTGAAIIVFSLFGFSPLQKVEEQKISEETGESKIQKKAIAEAAAKRELELEAGE